MRPLTPAAARALLLLVAGAFVALAVNASVLVPLWEAHDEHEHWLVVEHWARTGSMPDLTDMPVLSLNEGVQPPLAYWLFAAGALALDLQDTEFLARRAGTDQREPVVHHHGADEIFPFRGPARRLHWLRLLQVPVGLSVVLLTWALGRRLAPGRPGVAVGAAALVAFNPAFASLCAGITNDPLAVALGTAALLPLARLVRAPQPGARACLLAGALIGLALLAKLSTSFLLPLVPLALLLRRPRGEPRAVSLHAFDWIVAGCVAVSGLLFAWNLATYGDPFGWSVIEHKFSGERNVPAGTALLLRFLPEVTQSFVGQLAARVRAGPVVLLAWGGVAGLAALLALGAWLGHLWRTRPAARRAHARARTALAAHTAPTAPGADGRVAALLAAAVLLNLLAATLFFLDFNQPQGRYLHPTLPALACLLALGLARLPRLLALAGGAALALLAFHAQVHDLGPAFWPPSRAHDPHFMAFDPLAGTPPERRLPLLPLLSPADGSAHAAPPELRWRLPDDPSTRYTVHLSTPGLTRRVEVYEQGGPSVRDRYRIPASLWNSLPPGVSLEARVIRLPTLDEALAAPPGALDVVESAPLRLRRLPAPAD